MNCTDRRVAIDALLDGSLPPEEAKRLQSHLDTCENCRGVMADTQEMVSLLKGLSAPEVPDHAWPAARAAIAADRRRRRGLLVTAAALLLLIPASTLLLMNDGPPDLDLDIQDVTNGLDAAEWSAFMTDFSEAGGFTFVPPPLAEEETP